jgi:hypothetical protein
MGAIPRLATPRDAVGIKRGATRAHVRKGWDATRAVRPASVPEFEGPTRSRKSRMAIVVELDVHRAHDALDTGDVTTGRIAQCPGSVSPLVFKSDQ